ncbi:MAG: hypothetical protein QXO16_05585 [Archaeoglobaceae archaeon]
MKKVKVTLSLREDLVRSLKSKLAFEKRSLSDVVEEALILYEGSEFLERLCEALGFEKRYTFETRPKGFKAEEIVREIRDEFEKRLP